MSGWDMHHPHIQHHPTIMHIALHDHSATHSEVGGHAGLVAQGGRAATRPLRALALPGGEGLAGRGADIMVVGRVRAGLTTFLG
jgi:hypothetical protein